MKNSLFQIILSLFLVLCTTEFFWYQQASNKWEPVELEQEQKEELEEEEKGRSKWKPDNNSDDPTSIVNKILPKTLCFLHPEKRLFEGRLFHPLPLYLLYVQLKLYS
jgi:hypothetical protein